MYYSADRQANRHARATNKNWLNIKGHLLFIETSFTLFCDCRCCEGLFSFYSENILHSSQQPKRKKTKRKQFFFPLLPTRCCIKSFKHFIQSKTLGVQVYFSPVVFFSLRTMFLFYCHDFNISTLLVSWDVPWFVKKSSFHLFFYFFILHVPCLSFLSYDLTHIWIIFLFLLNALWSMTDHVVINVVFGHPSCHYSLYYCISLAVYFSLTLHPLSVFLSGLVFAISNIFADISCYLSSWQSPWHPSQAAG